jgi:hypothetical protein
LVIFLAHLSFDDEFSNIKKVEVVLIQAAVGLDPASEPFHDPLLLIEIRLVNFNHFFDLYHVDHLRFRQLLQQIVADTFFLSNPLEIVN